MLYTELGQTCRATLTVAHDRSMVADDVRTALSAQTDGLLRRINGLIQYRRSCSPNVVREDRARYDAEGRGDHDASFAPYAPDDAFTTQTQLSEL
jgi:hypothetical protein